MATLYVASTGTDNTVANGYGYPTGTNNGPMATVDYAYNQASSGDTIELEDNITITGQWEVDRAGVNIIVKGGGTSRKTFTTTAANVNTQFIEIKDGATNSNLTLQNLNLVGAGIGTLVFSHANCTGNITIDNCQVGASASGGSYDSALFIDGCGDLTITDSTILAHADEGAIKLKGTIGKFIIRNSAIGNSTSSSTDSGAVAINLSVSSTTCVLTSVVIEDSTIQHAKRCFVASSVDGTSRQVTCPAFRFYNTKFIGSAATNSSLVSLGIEVGAGITDWALEAEYTKGQILENDGQVYDCLTNNTADADNEPGTGVDWRAYWELHRAARVTMENCVIQSVAAGTNHNVLLGFGIYDSLISGCVSIGATGAGAYGFVCKGEANRILNSVFTGSNALAVYAGSFYTIENNTCISSTSTAGMVIGDQAGYWSTNNTIRNNVIVNTSTGVCLSFDADASDRGHLVDYNCYYRTAGGDTHNLYNQNRTLAEAQGDWATGSTLYGTTNDQNSISVNPNLDSNYRASSSALKNAGSPLLIKSDGTVLLRNDIGATKFEGSSRRGIFGGGGLFGN